MFRSRRRFEDATSFTITEDHLKLLPHLYIGWQNCEFGAPEVDPKRPYGNSFVYGDIAEILGIKAKETDFEEDYDGSDFEDDDIRRMEDLHAGLEIVLQIICSTATVQAGSYVKRPKRGMPDAWEPVS